MPSKSSVSGSPWGLPTELLEYGATVRDPVHGLIELSLLERLVLNSPPVQRLRQLRQLGTAYLAYSGATHTRLSHMIGTLETFQDLWGSIYRVSLRRHAFPNLLIEWREQGPEVFALRCEEARIAGRLAGLLHDVGHIPMGHALEDVFGLLPTHDAASGRVRLFFSQLAEHFDDLTRRKLLKPRLRNGLRTLIDGDLHREVLPMILSRAGLENPHRYPWLAAMVGDTLCADLLDYVRRDHLFTGLNYQLDDHALRALIITASSDRKYPRRAAIQTVRDGKDRPEVRNSMIDLLNARRRLFTSVNGHPVVLTSTTMAAKAVEALIAHERDRLGSGQSAIDAVEHILMTHGDDPLLQYLVNLGRNERHAARAGPGAGRDRRLIAAGNLAQGVFDRNLFTIAATCEARFADTICDWYAGSPGQSRFEQELAAAAEVDRAHVALWIGPRRMWAKNMGDMLVTEGKRARPLLNSSFGPEAETIERSHLDSWRAHLIVDRQVPRGKREQLRHELRRRTRAPWRRAPATTHDELLDLGL